MVMAAMVVPARPAGSRCPSLPGPPSRLSGPRRPESLEKPEVRTLDRKSRAFCGSFDHDPGGQAAPGFLDLRFCDSVAGDVGINEPVDHGHEQQSKGRGYDQAED